MINLEGQLVVITGGNGVLGRVMVQEALAAGAKVVSADIKSFDGELGENVEEYICDLTDEKDVEALVAHLVDKYGKIDGWVNNAYPRTSDWGNKLEDIPYDSWRWNVDKHMNSYFLCSQKVLAQMKKQQSGSLINLGSIYGILGADFNVYEGTEMTMPAAYSAIKGGITNMSRYLASYYGKDGVRVNTISPGGIFDHQPEKFVANYNKMCPAGRMGDRKEVAQAVVYLLSDYSSYVVGHNLVVDGGWSIV